MAEDLEYKVVATGGREALEKEVNHALSQGWRLYGPLAIAVGEAGAGAAENRGARLFAQAMVRGKAAESVYESRGPLTT